MMCLMDVCHVGNMFLICVSLMLDAVNTASRMESNSLPGRIHVSAETAELLRAANKGTWVTPREGGIEAKGKGRLETFWAVPKRSRSSISSSVFSSGVSIESEVSV